MFVHHLPETRGIGVIGHALEHQGNGAVGQRPIDDIAVAGDPAHVGGTPIDIAVVIVEDQLVGERGVDHIAAGGVQHALGLAGGARGIKNEQRVLGVHLFRLAGVIRGLADFVIPDVAAFLHGNRFAGAAHHHRGFDTGTIFQGLVHIGFERNLAAAT